MDEVGPTTIDNVAAYDSLAGKGIHTVLEVSLERITLGRKFAEWAADNAALLGEGYEDGVRELALAIISWNFGSTFVAGENGTEWDADSVVSPQE